jgi:hypothetical protein
MVKRSRSESLSSVSDAESPFLVTERASHRASPTSTEHSSRATKISHLDASSALDEQPAVMICYLPPHQPLDFATFEDYDVHYQKSHVNRCQECHKNFPSDHYLGLHIAEHHDPLNEIKRSRGEKTVRLVLFSCLTLLYFAVMALGRFVIRGRRFVYAFIYGSHMGTS